MLNHYGLIFSSTLKNKILIKVSQNDINYELLPYLERSDINTNKLCFMLNSKKRIIIYSKGYY